MEDGYYGFRCSEELLLSNYRGVLQQMLRFDRAFSGRRHQLEWQLRATEQLAAQFNFRAAFDIHRPVNTSTSDLRNLLYLRL